MSWAVIIAVSLLLPFLFIWSIWSDAHKLGWTAISKDSRMMYVDAMKTVASAGAVAASLVSAVVSTSAKTVLTYRPIPSTAKWSVVLLVASTLSSVAAILVLTRCYDRARARFPKHPFYLAAVAKGLAIDIEQGELLWPELKLILVLAYLGLVGFLLGFLLLARVVFLV